MPVDHKDNLHAGHRAKLKNKFREFGLEPFEDHNVLEMILFYAIPRRDTNEIAHRLVDRFGSLSGVLEASVNDLIEVPGVGENAALLIHSYLAVARRYGDSAARKVDLLPPHRKMKQIMIDHFAGLDHEQAYAIFYDLSLNRCGDCVLHDGDINTVGFSVRKLSEIILKFNASYMVLGHNHPGGVPIASQDDLRTTDDLSVFTAQLGTILLDHFIVAGNQCSSVMKDTYEDVLQDLKHNR